MPTTLSSTLDVTGATGIDGDFDINTNKFTVASATGNTAVAGTLDVTDAVTLIDGTLAVTYHYSLLSLVLRVTLPLQVILDAGTLSIDFTQSNHLVYSRYMLLVTLLSNSTLDVTGATGIDGDFDINTNKFTVEASSGNTAVAGTLDISAATTYLNCW